MTAVVKAYFTTRTSPQPNATLLTPEFLATVKPIWNAGLPNLEAFGLVQSLTLLERKQEGEQRLYRYRVVYKDTALMAVCTFNKEDKIAGLSLQPE